MQDRIGISLATEIGTLLPTTEPETGFGASAAVIASERYDWTTAHLNAGVFLSRTHHLGALAGLIIEGPFAWPVRPVIEGFFEREFDVATTASGLLGFIGRASDNLSFDGAVRLGRASDAKLVELRAGLTWAIAVRGR